VRMNGLPNYSEENIHYHVGKYLDDGNVAMVGRVDDQVKIRVSRMICLRPQRFWYANPWTSGLPHRTWGNRYASLTTFTHSRKCDIGPSRQYEPLCY
jgi:hypothetical protein